MTKNTRFLIQLAIAGLVLLFFVAPALAQETVRTDPAVVVAETEVTAEELDVDESVILPGSTFYFLKEWGWKIQEALTRDDATKTELVQKHVDQRLFDLQQVLEKNPELINKVQKTLLKSEVSLDKLKEKINQMAAKNNPQADKLVERFSEQAFKQVRLLDKMMAKIKEKPKSVEKLKEQVQDNLGEVLEKVDKEKVGNVLEKAEPRLNSVEVLKKVEAKLLERGNNKAAEAVREAYLRKIEKVSETLTPETVKQFLNESVDSTDSADKQKIVDEAQEKIKDWKKVQAIKKVQQEVRQETREQLKERIQQVTPAPVVESPELLNPAQVVE
ncbi:MAG: DUF5667 domain-containing protein [bacterium]